jgi:hypothetical protein
VALRFSTGLCLALVVTALALQWGAMLAALVPIGAIAVAVLFLAGATTAALVLGGMLVAACTTVTVTNLCIPSEALAWWDRHHPRTEAATT